MVAKQFKPLLASAIEDTSLLRFPLLASPKLDGVRALVLGGIVVGRSLKPIPSRAVQAAYGRLEGFDGELVLGDPKASGCFNRTTSAVMSVADDGKFLNFHVFDLASEVLRHETYKQRLLALSSAVKYHAPASVRLLQHKVVNDLSELQVYDAACRAAGYEGTMLRDPNGPYKWGRSTELEGTLLKLKQFTDAEAEVVGFEELLRNTNEAKTGRLGQTERSSHKAGMVGAGVLGALKVRDLASGTEFSIGTGFSDADRKKLWTKRKGLVGQLVKYKSQPSGAKDKPRFPVFLGFRDRVDL